jgi:hypothetical protein
VTFRLGLAHTILVGALAFGAVDACAQTPLDYPNAPSTADDLAEAEARREFLESRRLFAREGSEDLHLMVEREGKRARPTIFLLVFVCLVMFFVFALPLSERDEVVASKEPGDV